MKQRLTADDLVEQSMAFHGAGEVGDEHRAFGFLPAFLDRESGHIHLSCDARGIPAAIHQLDGLPREWVEARDNKGKPSMVKSSVVAGFVREGYFFTREQAAQLIQWELDKLAS